LEANMLSDYLHGLASSHYGFDKGTLQHIADGNWTAKQFFAFEKHDKPYVLRLDKKNADKLNHIRAEMDWLCYLSAKGISVSRPLRTVSGELTVYAEEAGEGYIITAYGKAEGRFYDVNDPNLWNSKVFFNWGKVMGDMHRVTKDYKPENEVYRYNDIRNNINESVKAFPSVDKAANALIEEINSLPKDRDSYGLVHGDLGPGNFLIDEDRINVFDFSDCAYTWFVNDIGAALTFAMWFGQRNDAGYDFAGDIFEHFLAGYLSANQLDAYWLSRIPLFLRLYQIAGFAHMNRRENPDDEGQKRQIRDIENGILFAGCRFDYSLFVAKAAGNNIPAAF